MMIEQAFANRRPCGRYRDRMLGPRGGVVWERPWTENLIVDGLSKLMAEMLRGDRAGARIAYWAVGRGSDSWDGGRQPAESDRRSWTGLRQETARNPILPDDIRSPDDLANQLEIQTSFTTEDISPGEDNRNWRLREFGLFVVDPSSGDSGVMINHVIHPRIDMQEGFTLQRTLRLTL